PCAQDDVDVGGVCGGGRNQAAGGVNVRLLQNFRLGGVADESQPALGRIARHLGLVAIDDDEGQRLARQLTRDAAANPPRAADDEVVRQVADLAVHASPAEDRL